jgi:outer membrane protein OmpU
VLHARTANVAGNFHANSAWSAGANYAHGPFAAALVYTRIADPVFDPYAQIGVKTFLGRTAATVDPATGAVTDVFEANRIKLDSQGILGVGASYAIGKATLMANFTDTTLKLGGAKSSMYVGEVGGSYQFTPALSAIGGYQYTKFEGTHWNQFTLGLDYFISKRTDIYLSGDYLQASNGTNPVIGYSFTPSLSPQQIDVRLGMRTAF